MSLIQGLSIGTQLFSSYVQSQGILAQSDAEASMLEHNAIVYTAEGNAIRRKAAYDEAVLRSQIRSVTSTQKARYSASGVLLEGSPTEVVMDTLVKGEMDAKQVREEGWYESMSMYQRATMANSMAKYTRKAGAYAARVGLMTGIGSALISGYQTGAFDGLKSSAAFKSGNTSGGGTIATAYKPITTASSFGEGVW